VDGKLELPRLGSQAGAWEPAQTINNLQSIFCCFLVILIILSQPLELGNQHNV